MGEWRDVPGYEGYYQVSDCGRVRSYPRTVLFHNGRWRKDKGRILVPYTNDHGYLTVSLSVNRKKKTVSVHRMVAAAFIGGCPDGLQVHHKNGTKSDNRANNLEYLDPIAHTHKGPNPSLTVADVRRVREMWATGRFTYTSLGRTLGFARSTIVSIIRGENWGWLDNYQATLPGHCKGECHPRAKLTGSQVVKIRELHSSGEYSLLSLAREFGVSAAAIRRIINGTGWQHIE